MPDYKHGRVRPKVDEEPGKCAAIFARLEGATIQRIGIYSTHRCSRKAKITLRHADGTEHSFCSQHARMAEEGFIDRDAGVMDPPSRADYQRFGSHLGHPPDHGKWTKVEE